MSLTSHDPPGFLQDLTTENQKIWSKLISSFMLSRGRVTPILTPQFYDATKQQESGRIAVKKITWTAFPRSILLRFNEPQRWIEADKTRSNQDEYCEWSVSRNSAGKITKVVFCNEGPEYFDILAQKQPDTLLSLYQQLNPGVQIVQSDLFIRTASGRLTYNPRNKFNNSTTTGAIMHLIQDANTLGAECDLAGLATVLRKNGKGQLVTSAQELIKCSKYGDPDRFSDPEIGIQVNGLAQAGAMITINNPVALYIDSVDLGDFSAPDGADVTQFWKWDRGTTTTDKQGNTFEYHMRATFEVPKSHNYVLGDLTYKDGPFKWGSQVAENIRISLYGRAYDVNGGHAISPRSCGQAPPESNLLATGSGNVLAAKVADNPASDVDIGTVEDEDDSPFGLGHKYLAQRGGH